MYKGKPKMAQRLSRAVEASVAHGRTYASAIRVVASLATVTLALVAIVYLADWSQLKVAVEQLAGQSWLLAVFVFAYTLAFLFRAVAWRVLSSGCIGVYQMFASIQSGLLINHLMPVKLGEIVRPLLAARYGMPIAEAASTTAIARYLDFTALLAIASAVGLATSLTTGTQLWLEGLAMPAAVILGCGGALLALQLLSVDQTGHARGIYNSEYLAKIEASDRKIDLAGGFDEARSVMDVAPTIACFLGAKPPTQSMDQVQGVADETKESEPLAVISPAHNERSSISGGCPRPCCGRC